jgi:hypothetical protein
MKNFYAIYKKSNGSVRYCLNSSPENIDASTPTNCSWIEIDKMLDGSWHVDLTTKSLIAGAIDDRSLDDVKASQKELLKSARDAVVYGGFTWNSKTFDSNAVSQVRISGAFALASNSTTAATAFPKTWILADNSTASLSASDMIAVGTALDSLVQGSFNTYDSLISQVNSATAIEQVKAIVWLAS